MNLFISLTIIFCIIIYIIFFPESIKPIGEEKNIIKPKKKKTKILELDQLITKYNKTHSKPYLEQIIVHYPTRPKTLELLNGLLDHKKWEIRLLASRHLDNLEGLYSLLEITPKNVSNNIISTIFRIENSTFLINLINIFLKTNSNELKENILDKISSTCNSEYSNFLINVIENYHINEKIITIKAIEALKNCNNVSSIHKLLSILDNNDLNNEVKDKIVILIEILKTKYNDLVHGNLSIEKHQDKEGRMSNISDKNGKLSINN